MEPERLQALVKELDSSRREERRAAARSPSEGGSPGRGATVSGPPRLGPAGCLHAVEALGTIGERRAIAPLVASMHRLFPARMPRLSTVGGVGWALALIAAGCTAFNLVTVVLSAPIGALTGVFEVPLGTAIPPLVAMLPVLAYLLRRRQERAELSAAITRALDRIATADPAVELTHALPGLRALANDGIQLDSATRDASRRVVERIGELTLPLHTLPIAAEAPSLDSTTLPRPSPVPGSRE